MTNSVEMKNDPQLEKSKAHLIVEIIGYMTKAVVIKSLIKKSNGNVSVMSFDAGEGLTEKRSPFDTFAHVIEGKAEIVINKIPIILTAGQGIVIPANATNFIKPKSRFKMILTVIGNNFD